MLLFVTTPLVRSVTSSAAYGLLGLGLPALLALWGAVTQVRRRLALGAVAALLALLLVAVGLTGLLPAFRGVALWLCTSAGGVLLVALVGVIERVRKSETPLTQRVSALTVGWE